MGDRRGVPGGRFSETVDAPFGAARHAQLCQRGRDALLRQKGQSLGSHSGPLPRGAGDRSETAPARRAGQVPHEWQLGEVLRQSLQRIRERVTGGGDDPQYGPRLSGVQAEGRGTGPGSAMAGNA